MFVVWTRVSNQVLGVSPPASPGIVAADHRARPEARDQCCCDPSEPGTERPHLV